MVGMKIHRVNETRLAFWCPGCDVAHHFNTSWTYNGDPERPTVRPSLLVTGYELRCHSFIQAGRIHFLADCWHDLKGQTVDLPEWPIEEGI